MVTSNFLDSELDNKGLWDHIGEEYQIRPAEINWCEPNYTTSYYIAEWQNTFSSLTITATGLLAFYWARKYKHPLSLQILSLIIAFVGIGSALFHGTLLFPMQLLDELPMMWGVGQFLYVFFNVAKVMMEKKLQFYNYATGSGVIQLRQKHLIVPPNVNQDRYLFLRQFYATSPLYYMMHELERISFIRHCIDSGFLNLGMTLFILMVSVSVIHGVFGFVIVFELTFGITSTLCGIGLIEMGGKFINKDNLAMLDLDSSSQQDPRQKQADEEFDDIIKRYNRWKIAYVTCSSSAFLCWLFDNNFCEFTRTQLPAYISFHALWHTISSLTVYIVIILAAYIQQMSKNAVVDGDYLMKYIKHQQSFVDRENTTKVELINVILRGGQVDEIDLIPRKFVTLCTPFVGVDNVKQIEVDL